MTRTPEELQLIGYGQSRKARKLREAARHDMTEALRRDVERLQAVKVGTTNAIACARTGERE